MLNPVGSIDLDDRPASPIHTFGGGFGNVRVVLASIVQRKLAEIVLDLVVVVRRELGRRGSESEVGDELVGRVVVHSPRVEEAMVFGVVVVEQRCEGFAGFGQNKRC